MKLDAISKMNPEIEMLNRKNEEPLLRFFEKKKEIIIKSTSAEKVYIEIRLPVFVSNPVSARF